MDITNNSSNIILFNKGENKEYFLDCITQIQKFNDCKIFFIGTDEKYLPKNIIYVDIETINGPKLEIYKKLNFYNNHCDPLWHTSMLRFFYIEEFMKQYNISNVFHFDNDILLYDKLDKVKNKCLSINEKMWITPCNEYMCICGMFFIPNIEIFSFLTDEIIKKISLGFEYLKSSPHAKIAGDDFMVNEMTILKMIADEANFFSFFPILPYGEFSNHYNDFKQCFDPASWGQYIGGTNNGHGPGFSSNKHAIGRKILDGTFIVNIQDYVPYIIDNNNNKYNLFNLHIHSKQLRKYT